MEDSRVTPSDQNYEETERNASRRAAQQKSGGALALMLSPVCVAS